MQSLIKKKKTDVKPKLIKIDMKPKLIYRDVKPKLILVLKIIMATRPRESDHDLTPAHK